LGSTGGFAAGGTAGPYFYHVKRTTEYRQGTYSLFCYGATTQSSASSILPPVTIQNVFDISSIDSLKSDMIILTPTSYTSSSSGVYVKIPSSFSPTFPGVYYSGTACSYRIILNDISAVPTYNLAGLIFNYYEYPSLANYYLTYNFYIPFGSSSTCYYVDIFYAPVASTVNANPRIFWKTCDGKSGFVTTTNKNTVGTFTSSGTTLSGSA
jgi:hypothetical protein